MLAHRERQNLETMNPRIGIQPETAFRVSWIPESILFRTKKSDTQKNRMTEIVSPASDPRSLRRHYPHQVQGVVQLDLSAIAAPPHLLIRIRPAFTKSTIRT